MNLTLEEQERQAFADGDYDLARTLARVIELEDTLADERSVIALQKSDLEHLKRILRDALADDCWRERAAAAIAE
jgi:phage shock protein A